MNVRVSSIKKDKSKQAKQINIWLGLAGVIMLLVALVLFILLLSLRIEELWVWYDYYLQIFQQVEEQVRGINSQIQLGLALLLLFGVRSLIPFCSVSALCFLSGAVLPNHYSLSINVLGVAILVSIKYFMGWRSGAKGAWRAVVNNAPVRKVLERDGAGNPWLLFVCRLIPSFPVNSISRIYGSMHFRYWEYLLISLLGFAPRLVSYTVIGKNVFDPLSPAFLTPIIFLLVIFGLILLSINTVWSFVDKNVRVTPHDWENIRKHRKERLQSIKKGIINKFQKK